MSKQLEFHPIANIFPMMSSEEFAELRNDIKTSGQLEPVWLHEDGRIIDGRNRYKACVELGIEPKYRTWDGKGSLTQFVVSLNLHRRHLSVEQRAAVAVKMLPMLEAEAKERQVEAGRLYGEKHPQELVENFPQALDAHEQKSRTQAAAIAGTNDRYVSDAKRIANDAPEVFEMMSAGSVNMPAAKQLADLDEPKRQAVLDKIQDASDGEGKIGGREMRKALRAVNQQERKEAPPLPDDKYRIWYADPPWRYNDSGVITETDAYGRAERHYPTMSIDELCEMGGQIKERCTDDAVLFLWVTSPLLEDAFPILHAWGFKYKSSFVWDKVRHNFAHYNSMRHEFLLVATRGSCTPDEKKLLDSVQSIERTSKHSEKPAEFREIIDTLYTWGKRIELFSRTDAEGWDTWGNEPC